MTMRCTCGIDITVVSDGQVDEVVHYHTFLLVFLGFKIANILTTEHCLGPKVSHANLTVKQMHHHKYHRTELPPKHRLQQYILQLTVTAVKLVNTLTE